MKKNYNLDEYLYPIWKAKKIVNETFMFLGEEDEAGFLYDPKNIEYVKSFSLDVDYIEGKDYVIRDGKIKRLKGSSIPYYTIEDYYPTDKGQYAIPLNYEKVPYKLSGEHYVLHGEGDFFTKNQIAVSYETDGVWAGAIPACKAEKLPKTHKKLLNGERLALTFYGDSIMTGCNSSGTDMGGNISPYMDAYPVMIKDFLNEKLSCKIEMSNVSQGGWSAQQGVDFFEERVTPTKPDLLIIGFGMNAGATPEEEYKKQMEIFIAKAKANNPEVEIILVATMLPNPESGWYENQEKYVYKLLEIEQEYPCVAVADMTTMNLDIFKRKRFRDITGNNINHPNDFLIRVYAQVIIETIIGDKL